MLARRRTSAWSFVAIAAAVLTALSVYSYLSYLRAQVPVAGRLVSVVVAAQDLEPGTLLTDASLEITQQPSRYLVPGTILSLSRALGKVVSTPVFKGEPLTVRKIAAKGGLSSVVPKGMRAYSLSVTSGSALNFIPKAGDKVDVIVTLPREVLGEASSITVLNDKSVASVGTIRAPGSGKVAAQLGQLGQLGLSPGAQSGLGITLFVTPEEAERLAMAESLGRITVVLAPDRPEGGPRPGPITPKDLGA